MELIPQFPVKAKASTTESAMPITCQRCHTMTTTKVVRCAKCLRIGYCSVECRDQHQPMHREKCSGSPVCGWSPEIVAQGNCSGFTHENPVIAAPPNSIGGINQDWTSDLPRNQLLVPKAAERLINAFRFRMHEEAQLLSNHNPMMKQATPMEQFAEFYKAVQSKNLLPCWWSTQCEQAMFRIAFQLLGKPFTQDDALRVQAFEPMILRMLADKAYGVPVRSMSRGNAVA